MIFAALVAAAASAGLASAPAAALPRPIFTAPYGLTAFTVSGSRIAYASGCEVLVVDLARGWRPTSLKPGGDCSDDPDDSAVDDLHLGRVTVDAQVIDAPSPHGEEDSLWSGPLPRGPVRLLHEGLTRFR